MTSKDIAARVLVVGMIAFSTGVWFGAGWPAGLAVGGACTMLLGLLGIMGAPK